MNAGDKALALRVLQSGVMEIEGVLPWSSNYAFLVTLCAEEVELPAVYKPRRGERPLWDFPQGTLSLREQAAFTVSEALGWDLVPPTVLRDGQHGLGSVQFFVAHDPDQHYFSFEGDPLFRRPLQKMTLFDAIINNADRKGGHVLIEKLDEDIEDPIIEETHLWGIDHGICFHEAYKLRTVIWEFAGDQIPASFLADLEALQLALQDPGGSLPAELAHLLNEKEIEALQSRVDRLLRERKFPVPGPGRHYPWPPV